MTSQDPAGNDGLEDVRYRVFRAESELEDIGLQIEFSRASVELADIPGWRHLVDRLQTIQAQQVSRLMSEKMGEYELGLRQGRLRTLHEILMAKPLAQADLDALRSQATMLTEYLSEQRALLTQ